MSVATTSAPQRDTTRRTSFWRRRSTLVGVEIAVPIVILALWWVLSARSRNTFFPPLQKIAQQLMTMLQTPKFLSDVASSLGNLAISFVLASILGVGLGALLGLVRPLAWFTNPVLHFFRAIPPVALVPIFVSLFGFGAETRILSITLAALFPTLIAALDGVRSVEPTLIMVSRAYRLSWRQRIVDVIMPAAGPRILSGMQVSLQTAFIVMIASEMLGSSVGLGSATLLAQQSFAIPAMWAGVIVLGFLGYATSALFALFRRRTLRWYIASQQNGRAL